MALEEYKPECPCPLSSPTGSDQCDHKWVDTNIERNVRGKGCCCLEVCEKCGDERMMAKEGEHAGSHY